MTKVVAALGLVAVLIFIHEFGHFVFAKVFGVGVRVFSLGFGRRLFGVVYKGTDYRLSLIPAGGYVMMEGADPFQDGGEGGDADSPTAFMNKPVWQRLIIVAAGPAFNLVLPIVVFTALYMGGQPQVGAWVGQVRYDSPAWNVGLRPGDQILQVDGTPVTLREDLYLPFEGADHDVDLEVAGKGTLTLELSPDFAASTGFTNLGLHAPFVSSRVGLSDPEGPAAQAGLRNGDLVDSVNGTAVTTWLEMKQVLDAADGQVTIAYRRALPDSDEIHEGEVTIAPGDYRAVHAENDPHNNPWGLYPADTIVYSIQEDSAAEIGGLLAGDRVVSLDGEPVHSWEDVIVAVAAKKEGEGLEARTLPIDFVLVRDGRVVELTIRPNMVRDTDAYGSYRVRPLVGFGTYAESTYPHLVRHRYGIVDATRKGFEDTLLITGGVLTTVGKLVTGEAAPSKTLGGPIQIFRDAASAAEGGIFSYGQMLAALSISLGIVNFLPVPVLDGGQFLFYLLEGIRGRPLSLRIRERAQQIGVLFLVGLMFAVLVMDLNRWLSG